MPLDINFYKKAYDLKNFDDNYIKNNFETIGREENRLCCINCFKKKITNFDTKLYTSININGFEKKCVFYYELINETNMKNNNLAKLRECKSLVPHLENKYNCKSYVDTLNLYKNNNNDFNNLESNYFKIKYLVNSEFINNVNLNDFYKVIYVSKYEEKNIFDSIIIINIGNEQVYYKMKDYLSKIKNIGNALFIFTIFNTMNNVRLDIFNIFSDINFVILEVINKGYDIGPFLLSLDYIQKNNLDYNVIFKIHTKSSDLTRFELLHELYENYNNIYKNLCNNNYYIYGCKKYCLRLDIINTLGIDNITKRNIYEKNIVPYFCAGTMFMCNKKFINYFNQIFDIKNYFLLESNYSRNENTHEFSLTHCLERIFGIIEYLILLDNNFGICDIKLFYENKYPKKRDLYELIKNNTNNTIIKKESKLLIYLEIFDYLNESHQTYQNLRYLHNDFDKIIVLTYNKEGMYPNNLGGKLFSQKGSYEKIKNIIKNENFPKTVIMVNNYILTNDLNDFYNCDNNNIYSYTDCYDINNQNELSIISDGNIIIIPNNFYYKLDNIDFNSFRNIDDYVNKIGKLFECKVFLDFNQILNKNNNYLSNILFTDDELYYKLLVNKKICIYNRSRYFNSNIDENYKIKEYIKSILF